MKEANPAADDKGMGTKEFISFPVSPIPVSTPVSAFSACS